MWMLKRSSHIIALLLSLFHIQFPYQPQSCEICHQSNRGAEFFLLAYSFDRMSTNELNVLTPELIELLASLLAKSNSNDTETSFDTDITPGKVAGKLTRAMSPSMIPETCVYDDSLFHKDSVQVTTPFTSVTPLRRFTSTASSTRGSEYMSSSYSGVGQMYNSATTVMIKNIPNRVTREELLDRISEVMPRGSFDFLYMPIDFNNRLNFGYAFLNLSNEMYIDLFTLSFNKKRMFDHMAGSKLIEVVVARVQGFNANVNRLIASPVLFNADDGSLPLIFSGETEIPFRNLMVLNREMMQQYQTKPSIEDLINVIMFNQDDDQNNQDKIVSGNIMTAWS